VIAGAPVDTVGVDRPTPGGGSTAELAPQVRRDDRWVWLLAAAAAIAVVISNLSGIATGDDGVGYRAMADSLLAGDGYGYFLEDPVTVWPPVWPGLMAFIALVTPLGTLGAAVALNAGTAAGVVLAGHRLLRLVVDDDRIVAAALAVMAVGPATIGLGHVLMTDLAFALVTMIWMLTLARFHRSGTWHWLVGAALLTWLAFGTRYVGLVLIAFGGLWLLLDVRERLLDRVRHAIVYGVVATTAPLAWMLRNRSIDGTFTGERNPSARGLTENAFDIAATLGRFLLPGVANDLVRAWAVVGVLALATGLALSWRVLVASDDPPAPVRRLVHLAGRPLGLIALFPLLYLTYMLYVRTTTALNQLDLRLLFPAYFPLLVVAMALAVRLDRLPGTDGAWRQRGRTVVFTWAAANVVAGLIGMVGFAAGHPYFDGNYEAEPFIEARRSPVLASLPDDCRIYSNLPNGLYPALESRWSPQRRAFESSREVDDLERITATLDDEPACLVWVDEQPNYGHLWPLDELDARLDLELLDAEGSVSAFRMRAPD